MIWNIHKLVLSKSLNDNNGNEVAVVCDLDSYDKKEVFLKQVAVIGTENEVKILEDKKANSIIKNARNISIFVAHNHPNNTTFSFGDL